MSVWKRNWVYIVATVLFGVWLAGQAIFQVFVANSPQPAFYWLNAANLLQLFASVVAGALLLVTNTRRPRGIDPDLPLRGSDWDRATVDTFSLTTEDLTRHERHRKRPQDIDLEPSDLERQDHPKPHKHVVLDEDGEPYGRRATDIPIRDIKRVITAVNQIKSAGADPEAVISVPVWAQELMLHVEDGTTSDRTPSDVAADPGAEAATHMDEEREGR